MKKYIQLEIPFDIEVWRPVVGYEDLYEVSNLGRVRSLSRIILRNNGIKQTIKERVISTVKNKNGYLYVALYKNGLLKTCTVHRIVAEAFLPNPNNLPCVNHKSEIRTENTVWVNENGSIDLEKSNLEWCDWKYNNNYGSTVMYRTERAKKTSKPIKQLSLDGTLLKIWPSIMEAERNGFKSGIICNCCKGRHNIHKGFRWEYA